MNRTRFEQIFAGFNQSRVLVIGDLILDRFVWGRVSRISPEAPVPVVEVDRETQYPGGAANVARNLREFTPHAAVLGMIGTDGHAHTLKQLLADEGIQIEAVQQDPDYQTIVKTRIIARHQQVVRVDRERKLQPTQAQYDRAIAFSRGCCRIWTQSLSRITGRVSSGSPLPMRSQGASGPRAGCWPSTPARTTRSTGTAPRS